ncbi:MAG: acyltransferase [Bacteroidia bacterium]|nr:acyltransferase [Bacteroidia bacterium]
MSQLKYLGKDSTGAISEFIYLKRLKWLQRITTPLTYLKAKLKGIQVGKKCRFFGVPYLRRSPLTQITIGNNCTFRSTFGSNLVGLNRPCLITTWYNEAVIEIGNNVGMSGTVIGAAKHIKIEDDVMCGGNVFITDFDWHPVHPARRHERAEAKPTHIKKNVWVGMNSVVLKGVTIGENSVIAANSVVTRDIPPNVIAGGNPCKVLKEFDESMLEELHSITQI